MKKLVVILAILYCNTQLLGQRNNYPDNHISTFSLFFDNDYVLEFAGLRKLNEDRNYTMGLGLLYGSNRLSKCFLFAPLHLLNRHLYQYELNDASNMRSIVLANGSFTPDDLRQQRPVFTDRPYGSITVLQTMVTGFRKRNGTIYFRHRKTASFGVGIIGTGIAREVQTAIHSSFNQNDTKPPYNPKGWHNQISNPGEPTLLYTLQHDFLLGKNSYELASTHGWGVQAKAGYRYAVGYHTGVNGLLQLRAGFINKKNWFMDVNNLQNTNKLLIAQQFLQPADSAHISLLNVSAQAVPIATETNQGLKCEFFVFGAARPQFLLYNALLNGQFKRSVHTLTFQETRHVLIEADGGIGAVIPFNKSRNMADVRFRISTRSPETRITGSPARWHFWGGIELGATFL